MSLDVVDEAICAGIMPCGRSASPQLGLDDLGKLLAKLNTAEDIQMIIHVLESASIVGSPQLHVHYILNFVDHRWQTCFGKH